MPWEPAIAAFGITAATILVGGAILIRLQRDRQHYRLMQSALDKGITVFPGMVPAWLVSLRVGLLTVVLGMGLIGAGIAFYNASVTIDFPASAPPLLIPGTQPITSPLPPPPAPTSNAGNRAPLPPLQPPPPAPEMERWHFIQRLRIGGLAAICAGFILLLLGIVRIICARFERTYLSPVYKNPTRSPND